MYFQTQLNGTGKRPVWSEDFPLVSIILTWAIWDRAPGISISPGAVIISVCFFA